MRCSECERGVDDFVSEAGTLSVQCSVCRQRLLDLLDRIPAGEVQEVWRAACREVDRRGTRIGYRLISRAWQTISNAS